jgi:diaminopimelate epimerase
MHGLGNDFMVVNLINQSFDYTQLPIAQLAHRHLGVGFDQLLIIAASADADFFCHIFNSDGSIAAQCGNGLRCVAKFVYETGLIQQKKFTLATKAGIYPVVIDNEECITVTMGSPIFTHTLTELHFDNDKSLTASILSLGNPHTIIRVDKLAPQSLETIAARIAHHPFFPSGTNLGLMEINNKHHIKLRTHERGAGATLACGSNACAAAAAGMVNNWLDDKVTVEFQYGCLSVTWDRKQNLIALSGPASLVYYGQLA